jgi:hypothetical protein
MGEGNRFLLIGPKQVAMIANGLSSTKKTYKTDRRPGPAAECWLSRPRDAAFRKPPTDEMQTFIAAGSRYL